MKDWSLKVHQPMSKWLLSYQWHGMKESMHHWLMKQWANESISQGSHESMNHWNTEAINQWVNPFNQFMNQQTNDSKNQSMRTWSNESIRKQTNKQTSKQAGKESGIQGFCQSMEHWSTESMKIDEELHRWNKQAIKQQGGAPPVMFVGLQSPWTIDITP